MGPSETKKALAPGREIARCGGDGGFTPLRGDTSSAPFGGTFPSRGRLTEVCHSTPRPIKGEGLRVRHLATRTHQGEGLRVRHSHRGPLKGKAFGVRHSAPRTHQGGRLGGGGGRSEKRLPWLGQAAAEASAPVNAGTVLLTDNGDERLCPREDAGNHSRP